MMALKRLCYAPLLLSSHLLSACMYLSMHEWPKPYVIIYIMEPMQYTVFEEFNHMVQFRV